MRVPLCSHGNDSYIVLTVCGAVNHGCVFFQVSVMNVAKEDFINWKTLKVKGSDIPVLH